MFLRYLFSCFAAHQIYTCLRKSMPAGVLAEASVFDCHYIFLQVLLAPIKWKDRIGAITDLVPYLKTKHENK